MEQPIQLTYEPLNWEGKGFEYQEMVKIPTIGDGSSLLHAIAASYFKLYRQRRNPDGEPFDRTQFIRKLRRDMADKLAETVNHENTMTYYETLGNGAIRDLGERHPRFSLESLQKILRSNQPIGATFFEYVSNTFNKDLYFLSRGSKDVYMIENLDEYLLYKGRDSIVLLHQGNHIDLIGLNHPQSGIKTLFSSDHPFIQAIQRRLREKIAEKKTTQKKKSNE